MRDAYLLGVNLYWGTPFPHRNSPVNLEHPRVHLSEQSNGEWYPDLPRISHRFIALIFQRTQ